MIKLTSRARGAGVGVLIASALLVSACLPRASNEGHADKFADAGDKPSLATNIVRGSTVAVGGSIIVDVGGGKTVEYPDGHAKYYRLDGSVSDTGLEPGAIVRLTVVDGVLTKVEQLSIQGEDTPPEAPSVIGKVVGAGPALVIATDDGRLVDYAFTDDALLLKGGQPLDWSSLRGNMNVVVTLEGGRIAKLEVDP